VNKDDENWLRRRGVYPILKSADCRGSLHCFIGDIRWRGGDHPPTSLQSSNWGRDTLMSPML